MAQSHGIPLKKQFGQHFLRAQIYADHAVQAVQLSSRSSVFEIGCGDGFLTRTILEQPVERLWVFEIDPHWVEHVQKTIRDPRLQAFHENILDVDLSVRLQGHEPWTLIANLPYQVTFPILHLLQKNRHLLSEAVVMVQEEVAQKLAKTEGRGYGYISLFFQHYFTIKLLDKVPPTAFVPPPKVYSRLIYLQPQYPEPIAHEEGFWKFIKVCFSQPRRMLRNNLQGSAFDIQKVPVEYLHLRAQQMSMADFMRIWNIFCS